MTAAVSAPTRRLVARLDVADVPEGTCRRAAYPPFDVLVSNVGGRFFAIEDACNHAGVSLASGTLEGHRVTCPAHGYVFDARTGQLLLPSRGCDAQRTFTVEARGESLEIWDDAAVRVLGAPPTTTPLDEREKPR